MTDKDIYWQNDQTPASRQYEDIYFSPEDGLAESRHVFLEGINAPEVWQKKGHFTLLENGFGTGLNFIMTCHEWLKMANADRKLIYIATEKHPPGTEDINHALKVWPELSKEKKALLDIYPPSVMGFHQRELYGGQVKLILLYGDSVEMLGQLEASVDAIYLDGFAPAKNPDMWSEDIFCELARLAIPDAPLATFTAAGFVKRRLEARGFKTSKRKGFGQKREMLRGKFTGKTTPSAKPWFDRPPPLPKGRHITIIGGGIAGLCTGLILQNHGYKVTVFEREDAPMDQASGNPAGIIDPYLNAGNGPDSQFYRAALLHALSFYPALNSDILLVKGLYKYPQNPTEIKKFAKILAQKILPENLLQKGPDGSLFFPQCGAMAPPRIKEALAQRLNIKTGVNICHLEYDQQWILHENNGTCHQADAVILCGGAATASFSQSNKLPLTPVRGQISLLDAEKIKTTPDKVLCAKGYLIPPVEINGKMTMITGATFGRNDTGLDIRPQDHAENLENAQKLWPKINDNMITGGRVALRAYSPDHMPIAGPIADHDACQKAYEMLKHGPRHQEFATAPYQPDLYVMSGLGARGFLAAPLLAELMASLITGEPLPVPGSVYEALHPMRFQIRDLIKG